MASLSSDDSPFLCKDVSSDLDTTHDGNYDVILLDDRMDTADSVINPSIQDPPLSFELYYSFRGPALTLHPQDFCRLSYSDQKKVLFAMERLDTDSFECRELPPNLQQELLAKLRNGTEKRSVYTSNLEEAVVVKSMSVFPPIAVYNPEEFTNSLLLHPSAKWTKWINSETVYSLEEQRPDPNQEFHHALDMDATILHTDTLKALKHCIHFSLTPQYSKYAMKIKHEYKGITLHNVVNVKIGKVSGKWSVYACFLDCPKSKFAAPKQLIEAFYVKFLEGLIASPQGGTVGAWRSHIQAFTSNKFTQKIKGTVEIGSFDSIEVKLANFTFNGFKTRICFSFQYYGKKEVVTRAGFEAQMKSLAATFNLRDICDPKNHLFDNTVFIQDLAFTISPPADHRNLMSVLWSPQYLKLFSMPSKSPLGKLFGGNERHSDKEVVQPDGNFVIYPNLGIGQMASCMIDWSSKQYAVREVKVYCASSQFWRNNAPYDGTCYTVGVVPFDILCHGSDIPEVTRRSLIDKAQEISKKFARNTEKDNIDRIMRTIRETTAGIRLEISFQNLGVDRLLAAYDELELLAKCIVQTHLAVTQLCEERSLPWESMRFSPIQLVSSSSIKLLAEYQAKALHTMFSDIYKQAMTGTCSLQKTSYWAPIANIFKEQETLNLDAINALALLEDLQQLLWSGSIPTLHNPKLFSALGVLSRIFTQNRVNLPAGVFSFDWHNPTKSLCNLPQLTTTLSSKEVDEEEDATEVVTPQLALTKRFLYQAFRWRASQVTELCSSLSAAVSLQVTVKDDLFQPLYKSKSMILAASLLNSLFNRIFEAMNVKQHARPQLFKAMSRQQPFQLLNVKCGRDFKFTRRFLECCFPIHTDTVGPTIATQPFYTSWLSAIASFAEFNEEMHFKNYQDVDKKDGDTYPVVPGITHKDVHHQMQILMFVNQIHWVPVLGTASFLLSSGGYYAMDGVVPEYSSSLFISSLAIHGGAPLPHPVDNSFIFMLAKRVGKKIEKEREIFVRKYKESREKEARLEPRKPSVLMKPYKQRSDPNLVAYKAHEIIGHILFQYFHMPLQSEFSQKKFSKAVHYGNVTKSVLLDCGLLKASDNGKGYQQVSKEAAWELYQKLTSLV